MLKKIIILGNSSTGKSTLKAWIEQYPYRDDEYSLFCHSRIFTSFQGKKIEYNQNWQRSQVLAWLAKEENIKEC